MGTRTDTLLRQKLHQRPARGRARRVLKGQSRRGPQPWRGAKGRGLKGGSTFQAKVGRGRKVTKATRRRRH